MPVHWRKIVFFKHVSGLKIITQRESFGKNQLKSERIRVNLPGYAKQTEAGSHCARMV